MHKKKITIIFLFVLFTTGCMGLEKSNLYDAETTLDTDEIGLIEVKESSYDIITKTFLQGEINVSYPQIQGLDNEKYEAEISALIEKDLFETQINMQLEEVKTAVENYDIDEGYSLVLDYEVTLQTDKLLSILYTGIGSFKTSQFPTYVIYAITIDLENMTMLCLSDFVDINENLVQEMKNSVNVTNGAVKDGMDQDKLIDVVSMVVGENEDYIIKVFQNSSGGGGPYTFAITPNSFLISISIAHAAGDYALIEIPRERLMDTKC